MKIAINGYGHVGRGVEAVVRGFPDLELCAVFTRRVEEVRRLCRLPVFDVSEAAAHSGELDAVIMCGGSADDLPRDSPEFARIYNIVDSFDRHEVLDAHLARLDAAARESGHVAITAAGWDPGLMSLARLYFSAFLPYGVTQTQWGPGISRGHTEVLRSIRGVEGAVQLTIPIDTEQSDTKQSGSELFSSDVTDCHARHRRVCCIVPSPGAERADIERAIRSHEYFRGYDTQVRFVTRAELDALCGGEGRDRHGGRVERVGVSGGAGRTEVSGGVERTEASGAGRTEVSGGGVDRLTLRLELSSNAYFTASVLCATARAAVRMSRAGQCGAFTLANVAPSLLAEGCITHYPIFF